MRWVVLLLALVALGGCSRQTSPPATVTAPKKVYGKPITKRIEIPMRDGTLTVATLQLPAAEGKFPVLLCRTPYGREQFFPKGYPPQYAIVCQDVRGRGDSKGEWEPFFNERKDGYDTVQWIASQSWSNGRVGMVGASYMAYTQWAALAENPPALKAIVSDSTPPDPYQNIPYENGCFLLATSLWYAGLIDPSGAGGSGPYTAYQVKPLSRVDVSVSGKSNPTFQKWLRRERPEDWKDADTLSDIASSKIPALLLSGWQDGDHIGTYLRWTARPDFPDQHLIIGPWGHGAPQGVDPGEITFGDGSKTSVQEYRDRFLAVYLEGDPQAPKFEYKGAVKIQGMDNWVRVRNWPSLRVEKKDFLLDLDDKGSPILTTTPSQTRKEAKYVYDPNRVNVISGLKVNVLDDMSPGWLKESDLPYGRLVFRSPLMDSDLVIAGPTAVSMRFSTSAVDTDFFLQLFDEFEGEYKPIGQAGKFRCRYTVTQGGALLTPGKEYTVETSTWDAGYVLSAGHRLSLMVSSDRFPVYALNLNTGEPLATGTRSAVAEQRIFVGQALSRVTVPVLGFSRSGFSGRVGRPIPQ